MKPQQSLSSSLLKLPKRVVQLLQGLKASSHKLRDSHPEEEIMVDAVVG